jgi:uncharacterized YccA/Bax inhibitor family protein
MSLLVHFLIGALGALAIFLVAARVTRTESFSFPSAAVLVGFFCAVASHFASPWATPAILLLYAIATANETRAELAAKKASTSRSRPSDEPS